MSFLPDDVPRPLFLTFNGAAFIPAKGAQQRVVLSVAGHEVGRWTFTEATAVGDRTVTIPRELFAGGEVKLDFAFPDAVSPAERHISADTRKLAYHVRSFTIGDPNGSLYAGDTWPSKSSPASAVKFGEGWANQEPAGRWTDGKHASLFLRVDKSGPTVDLTVDANAFIARAGMAQRIGVSAAGQHLADWTYDDKSQTGARTVSVPSSLIKPDGELTLDFDLPDATSPAESRVSGDPRHLGIFVKSLSLGPLASK